MFLKPLTSRFFGAVIALIVANGPTADKLVPRSSGEPVKIFVSGPLNWDAVEQFIRDSDAVTNAGAVVFFNSEGGDLFAALLIGQSVRQKNFWTAVNKTGRCEAECALAWLAGVLRFLEPPARIGFRAASDVGNASLIAYLNELGLSPLAKAYVVETSPQDMNWLDYAQAVKLGIAISSWQTTATHPPQVLSGSRWDFDGSTLVLIADGSERTLYYETVTPRLVEMGVRRGTLFFAGHQEGRSYRGHLNLFSKQCGAGASSVSGEVSEDNQTIVVQGEGPSSDEQCKIAITKLVRIGEAPASDPPTGVPARPPSPSRIWMRRD